MPGKVLVSDAMGRLKPCLRCGYSLIHIHEARNCPECGLAIRISLGGNRALEWSNPTWLGWLVAATAVLGMAHLLIPLQWLFQQWFILMQSHFAQSPNMVVNYIQSFLWPVALFLSGLGMCLLGRSERRCPDDIWFVRWALIGIGVCEMALAVDTTYYVWAFWIAPGGRTPAYWEAWVSSFARGPWPLWFGDLAMTIVVGAIGLRGKWRRFNGYFVFVVLVVLLSCLGNLTRYVHIEDYWLYFAIGFQCKCVYGLTLGVFLFWATSNLYRCRREALANWVSD